MGGEEGFVGVDVTEAGETGLVEEEVFDNSLGIKDLLELLECDLVGFGA